MKSIAMALLLSSCSMRVNGVKIPDRTSAKMDPQTSFYITTSFFLAFALTTHFYNPGK